MASANLSISTVSPLKPASDENISSLAFEASSYCFLSSSTFARASSTVCGSPASSLTNSLCALVALPMPIARAATAAASTPSGLAAIAVFHAYCAAVAREICPVSTPTAISLTENTPFSVASATAAFPLSAVKNESADAFAVNIVAIFAMAFPAIFTPIAVPATVAAVAANSNAVTRRSIALFVSRRYEIASTVAVPTPVTICCTRGIMFFPAVNTLSTKSWVSPSMSALLSAMPVARFCHAAFMDAVEPSIVLAASSAA